MDKNSPNGLFFFESTLLVTRPVKLSKLYFAYSGLGKCEQYNVRIS